MKTLIAKTRRVNNVDLARGPPINHHFLSPRSILNPNAAAGHLFIFLGAW
jgi:hypothetical protein